MPQPKLTMREQETDLIQKVRASEDYELENHAD